MIETYTAAQIAEGIGWSKRRVVSALERVPATTIKIVSGNSAKSWAVSALPANLAAEIARLQVVHRFRCADDVLLNPALRWQPAIPLTRICERDVRRADQLREALSSAMILGEEVSLSERARRAALNYKRVFGREITSRQLRAIISRTLDRDRGSHDFGRLEIYLPEGLHENTSPAARASAPRFDELRDDLATLLDRNNLTVSERAFCWRKVIACYLARVASGEKAKAVKSGLCEHILTEVPGLAGTGVAVRRNFERKLIAAETSGVETLIDRRTENSGPRKKLPSFVADIEKIARHARHETGGRISQAYRELHNGALGDRFSQEFREHFPFDVRTAKSDVPASVRAAVRTILSATEAIHRGPKTSRIAGPSVRRDWSNVFAGDSYSADDFTFNHPFIEWDERGEYVFEGERFNLTRGQTLLFCDERSLRIHGYYLTPRPNYGAGTICAGINRICMDETIGLPFRRFLFERGLWKARAVKSSVDWARIDQVFAQEGVEFASRDGSLGGLPVIVHATTPKAKVIERIGGTVQNLMQGLPGYVGRNQRLDGPEQTANATARLRHHDQRYKADCDPRESFLIKEQFCTALEDAIRRYNAEPQNGKMLEGRSPEEGWKELHPANGKPHKLLPESLRYLLATETAEITVSDEGITLARRGQPSRNYCGHPRLGELIGEKVRVRFNVEMPELITVCHLRSDPRELRPFSVCIDPSVPALDATKDDFDRARHARGLFRKFGRDVYRVIKPKFNLTVLDQNTGSDDARRTGEALIAESRAHIALDGVRQRDGRQAERIAARHGLQLDSKKLRRPELARRSAEQLDELESRILQKEGGK